MIVGANPLLLKVSGGTDWENAVNSLSPTAWWRLGETSGTDALDENATYDGTYIGSPSLNQSSLVAGDDNPCIRLNGSSQLVSMGDVLNVGAQDFSVVIWVNPDTLVGGSAQRAFQKRGGGGLGTQSGWQIGTSSGFNNTLIDAGDGSYSQITSTGFGNVSNGNISMLCLTWSNENERLRLYTNDALLATGSVTGSLSGKSISTTRPMTLGCSDNGGGARSQFWDGFVDEGLFFLGTELTASNVSDLYTAGS